MTIETLSETNCFGGRIGFYRHASAANNCEFSVFVPPQAADGNVPVVTFLSGLTCTEENFMVKSGAQRYAAELGLMLVSPDTSPRGEGVPDDPDGDYDFGLAAGFYLNATEEPWSKHYRMYDYVMNELQPAIFDNFPGDAERHGLTGHSMGGHGALTDDTASWYEYDACEVAKNVSDGSSYSKILVDQGGADAFLEEQLQPALFQAACAQSGLPLELRLHDGYDHGYYFISTFIEDHLRHHAALLDNRK